MSNETEQAQNYHTIALTEGDTIWDLAAEQLESRGIENPTIAQIDALKDKILQENNITEKEARSLHVGREIKVSGHTPDAQPSLSAEGAVRNLEEDLQALNGTEVAAQIQQNLIDKGLDVGSAGADGYLTTSANGLSNTQEAMVQFFEKNPELLENGVSIEELQTALSQQPQTEQTSSPVETGVEAASLSERTDESTLLDSNSNFAHAEPLSGEGQQPLSVNTGTTVPATGSSSDVIPSNSVSESTVSYTPTHTVPFSEVELQYPEVARFSALPSDTPASASSPQTPGVITAEPVHDAATHVSGGETISGNTTGEVQSPDKPPETLNPNGNGIQYAANVSDEFAQRVEVGADRVAQSTPPSTTPVADTGASDTAEPVQPDETATAAAPSISGTVTHTASNSEISLPETPSTSVVSSRPEFEAATQERTELPPYVSVPESMEGKLDSIEWSEAEIKTLDDVSAYLQEHGTVEEAEMVQAYIDQGDQLSAHHAAMDFLYDTISSEANNAYFNATVIDGMEPEVAQSHLQENMGISEMDAVGALYLNQTEEMLSQRGLLNLGNGHVGVQYSNASATESGEQISHNGGVSGTFDAARLAQPTNAGSTAAELGQAQPQPLPA